MADAPGGTRRETGASMTDLKAKVIARLTKKPGLRGRVDAMCCECIYDRLSPGTWRGQVENCTSSRCPLWPIRTRSAKEKTGDLQEHIKA